MSKNIKPLISEISRINDLMLFTENRGLLNESAALLRNLRLLVKSSVDDLAKYGIKEIDNLVKSMMNAKTVDDFFELLDGVKTHSDDAAFELRRDVFAQLPESMRNLTEETIKVIESRLDDIPTNRMEQFLDDLVESSFESQPESVKKYLKDTIKDRSEKISNKIGESKPSSSIDDLINDLDIEKGGQKLLNTDEEIVKAFKKDNPWWSNSVTRMFYDGRKNLSRVLQNKNIDDVTRASLKGKTKEQIRDLVKKELHSGKATDEFYELMKDKSFYGMFTRLSTKAKMSLLVSLVLFHRPLYLAIVGIMTIADELGIGAEDLLEDLETGQENRETVRKGGITSLNKENETRINEVLFAEFPQFYDNDGNLLSDYSFTFYDKGDKIEILDSNYDVVKSLTLDEFNNLAYRN